MDIRDLFEKAVEHAYLTRADQWSRDDAREAVLTFLRHLRDSGPVDWHPMLSVVIAFGEMPGRSPKPSNTP